MIITIAYRAFVPVLAAALLNTCVSTARAAEPATKAAVASYRDASTEAYVGCLIRAVGRLDDYRSDPGTIATAIMSACAPEFDLYAKIKNRGEDIARSLHEANYGSVIQFVLQNRKAAGHAGHILKLGRYTPARLRSHPSQSPVPAQPYSAYAWLGF
jgi:Ni,Fe-hydrogenase III large subunit